MTAVISQVVSTSSAVHDPGGMTNLNVDPGAMGMDLPFLRSAQAIHLSKTNQRGNCQDSLGNYLIMFFVQ